MIASKTAPIRIGVIGVGFMGRQHVEFIHAASGVELSAVADPAAAEGSFGCPRYQDAAAMLESEELDAVIIANPNALHVDTAITCLEAGVAVHLEKPVAVDYTQSLRLVDAVTRLNGRLLVGRRATAFSAVELADTEKPELVRAYLKSWKWEVGAFFGGVGPDSSDEELRRIAPDHPVFRLSE